MASSISNYIPYGLENTSKDVHKVASLQLYRMQIRVFWLDSLGCLLMWLLKSDMPTRNSVILNPMMKPSAVLWSVLVSNCFHHIVCPLWTESHLSRLYKSIASKRKGCTRLKSWWKLYYVIYQNNWLGVKFPPRARILIFLFNLLQSLETPLQGPSKNGNTYASSNFLSFFDDPIQIRKNHF